jgi:hypothetical protein
MVRWVEGERSEMRGERLTKKVGLVGRGLVFATKFIGAWCGEEEETHLKTRKDIVEPHSVGPV